jgi:hypothetical protein
MRILRFLLAALFLAHIIGCAQKSGSTIDFLDYFLQNDDTRQRWTLCGTEVLPAEDPDGTDTQTFVMNKWSSPSCFEVYKVTANQVQMRYEVVRSDGAKQKEFWIRRFEEVDGEGPAPGAVWCKRFINPGGPGFLSRFRQDHFVLDEKTAAYVLKKEGSVAEMSSFISVNWAFDDWRYHNYTGLHLNPVLRLTSEWQHDGLMIEMYDYAQGKGLVAWRWLERVSTLRPKEGEVTGKIFHCENGYVSVESRGDDHRPPAVYKFDDAKKTLHERLECVRLTSHWRPEKGPQWYVVFRNTIRENPLILKSERVGHDYSLPEWKGKPSATLKDLPYQFTHPPLGAGSVARENSIANP